MLFTSFIVRIIILTLYPAFTAAHDAKRKDADEKYFKEEEESNNAQPSLDYARILQSIVELQIDSIYVDVCVLVSTLVDHHKIIELFNVVAICFSCCVKSSIYNWHGNQEYTVCSDVGEGSYCWLLHVHYNALTK